MEAVKKAKHAFSKLPNGDQLFQQCVKSPLSIVEAVESAQQTQKKKKSTKILECLQRHTSWLQNISSVVDVAVQTKADIACPIWAPLKFAILVVNQDSKASEEITRFLDTTGNCFRQIELYKELGLDPTLQIPLLALFADVVEFSLKAIEHFGRRSLSEYYTMS